MEINKKELIKLGYYKEIDKVSIEGENYSAVTTAGEMKKRGVRKAEGKVIDNEVVKVELIDYYAVSGAVEYGLGVRMECTFRSGDKVKIVGDGMDFLGWIKTHTSVNGVIEGDFLILFQGVVVRLVERGSKAHKDFNQRYEKQENKKKKVKKLEVQVGDIVKISYSTVVYLGEFYYYKPNLRKGSMHNKLRKYKLYAEHSEEKDYLDGSGLLYVESGKTQYNQPTEILGHVEVDMDLLLQKTREYYGNMGKVDVGYYKNDGAFFRGWRSRKGQNDRAYVLTHIGETKEDVIYPREEEILNNGWLCGWKYDKSSYKEVENRMGRDNPPHVYQKVE